jgi:hypothetical protein
LRARTAHCGLILLAVVVAEFLLNAVKPPEFTS